eukprot:GHVO01009879.1.p1 GENE.GHVO01009879.1~~GHVO01009879.1.p1  ORF type:complete len:200 (+),score=16.87 GHVO01009879.1:32-601(+)
MADNDSVVISCLAKGLQRLFEQQSRGDRWVLDATSILNYLEEREKVARERNDGKPFLKYDASKSYRDILKKMDEQDDTSNVITAPLAGPEIVKKCSIHEKADEHDDVATTLESQKSETKSSQLPEPTSSISMCRSLDNYQNFGRLSDACFVEHFRAWRRSIRKSSAERGIGKGDCRPCGSRPRYMRMRC